MNKRVISLSLTSITTLAIGVSGFVYAEKGGHGNADHANKGLGAKAEHSITQPEKANKGAGASVKHQVALPQKSQGKAEARFNNDNQQRQAVKSNPSRKALDQKEARDNSVKERKDTFQAARDDFKQAKQEARADFKSETLKRNNDRDLQTINLKNDGRYRVDTAQHRDVIVHILDSQNGDDSRGFFSGFPFFGSPEFTVGKTISDDMVNRIQLLPLSINSELGLPVNDMIRVGVVDNQLVVIDMDRLLVMDVLRRDEGGRLVTVNAEVLDDRIFLVRLDDNDEVIARRFLTANTQYIPRYGFIDNLRYNVFGFGSPVIGEPLRAEVTYLPESLIPQMGLPMTDLRLGLIGDDMVLIDPDTALVMDVASNII